MGTNLIRGILSLALYAFPFSVNAQKLPTVQKISVFAPADMKVDGKANEWHNQFEAYNNANDIYYTIANDNDNLYFVIRAKYNEVLDKIIRGGITITINHSVNKKDLNAVSVTYPVLRDNDMTLVTSMIARKSYPKANSDTSVTVQVDDLNQLLESKAKQINIAGIKSIADSSISVYNTQGLKAAELFDRKMQYTCELAIPLKFLSLSAGRPFSYQVKLNEPAAFKLIPGGKFPPPMVGQGGIKIATTDFWGEYVLAK